MRESRILLVQCCHLPQFFYIAEKIRQYHPEWNLDALFGAPSQVDFYLDRFPYFQRVHFLDNDVQTLPAASDVKAVVFPLLNRGYWKIKKAARGLSLVNLEVDYRGELHPLLSRRLYSSRIRVLPPPDADFVAYARHFPLPPLGKRILLVESCHSSVPGKFQGRLDQIIPMDAQITRIQKDPIKEFRRHLGTHHFEGGVVFFSGEPGFALLRLLPFWLRIPRIVVVTETGQFFDADARKLCRFLWGRIRYGISPPKSPPRIVLVQTETVSHVQHVIGQLKKKELFPRSEIVLICRQEDRVHFESNRHVDRLMTYSRTGIRDRFRLWKRLRKLDPDVLCAIFSGRPYFRRPKLLFLSLPTRRRLVFNAGLECYDLKPRTFFRIFKREPLLLEVAPPQPPPRIVLVQTETVPHVEHVIGQLKEEKFFPCSEVVLLCRQEDRGHFESNPQIDRVMTYGRTGIRDHFQLWKRLRKLDPDVLCAIFSGRPYFRKPKLLFFSLPTRRRLVFNAGLGCYDLKPRTFFRIFKREPLLLERETSTVSLNAAPRVLMLQTEDSVETIKAIEVLSSEKVASRARVSVFCSAEMQGAFESLPQVEETLVYDPAKPIEGLLALWKTAWSGADVVACIFSDRPIFWKQKFLFFLLPVRYRLVFNEHLECFYLGWRNVHHLFHRRSHVSVLTMVLLIVRKVAKVFLFLPRFAFLLVWVTFMKLKRIDS